MKVIIIGSSGQLGQDLIENLTHNNHEVIAPMSSEIDVTKNIEDLRNYKFDYLINCSSYHKVDELEENIDKAFQVNSIAVQRMAQICKDNRSKFVTFSTDYIFGKTSSCKKIHEDEISIPLNIYGLSKLYGENMALNSNNDSIIFRVASLFGKAGSSGKGGNFVESIINAAKLKTEIEVVDDQIMSPTSTSFVAQAVSKMLPMNLAGGSYNMVCEGEVSWFQFASDIIQRTGQDCKVLKIKAEQLNQLAKRPSYSALSTEKISKLGIEVPSYLIELDKYLKIKGHT